MNYVNGSPRRQIRPGCSLARSGSNAASSSASWGVTLGRDRDSMPAIMGVLGWPVLGCGTRRLACAPGVASARTCLRTPLAARHSLLRSLRLSCSERDRAWLGPRMDQSRSSPCTQNDTTSIQYTRYSHEYPTTTNYEWRIRRTM
jgi:hypothetical protein